MQLLPMASSDKGWFFQCNYLGGKLENTEPIILAFELGARKAGLLPGCFLQVKKGFPGTDTELTRHFVTLFAEQHWWGVSIYIGGFTFKTWACQIQSFGGYFAQHFVLWFGGGVFMKYLYSGCNNCCCIFIHNSQWCNSSTDGSPQILSLHSIHIHWNWMSRGKTIFVFFAISWSRRMWNGIIL